MEKRIEELEKKVERLEKQLIQLQGVMSCSISSIHQQIKEIKSSSLILS